MIYLIGAGGHGKVVLEALLLAGCEVEVLDADSALTGAKTLGKTIGREEKVLLRLEGAVQFLVGIGDGASRRRVVERWEGRGHHLARMVHPRAILSPSATVAEGAVVMAGAVIQAEAAIGKGAIVNTGATVDHDCRIGAFAHIAPGAHLAGNVEVQEEAWIGIGSSVREGVVIARGCVVGAGAVVVDDLPADVVAHGNPCRVMRQIGRSSEVDSRQSTVDSDGSTELRK